MHDALEWPALSRETVLGRLLLYAPYGLFGGFGLVVVGALGVFTTLQAAHDSIHPLIVVAFVGGPLSLLSLFVLVTQGSDLGRWANVLFPAANATRRGLVWAVLLGALVVVGLIVLWPAVAIAVVFLGTPLLASISSAVSTTVSLEPTDRRVTLSTDREGGDSEPTEIDLANVSAVSRIPLGTTTLYVCRRVGAHAAFVPVPNEHRSLFERALEDGIRAPSPADPASASTTGAMRIVLAVAGLKSVAIAAIFVYLVLETGNTAGARAFGALASLALFGLGMIAYAGYESWLARREPIDG
ncbi:GumC domain-containing protein [Natronorubrum thiooxidans]|uniref:PH domain-containing protein n=1 Tax=Natronorubrum thiooxidans TaxID=308853 RepID=A0A1N7GGZ0_9EURY|nr:hypothetical protein [Natronorubrum thiooxidans]SIS11857.1 hypothetical protein SAMN05421752_11247 [Natronorubrum thiooxidans]